MIMISNWILECQLHLKTHNFSIPMFHFSIFYFMFLDVTFVKNDNLNLKKIITNIHLKYECLQKNILKLNLLSIRFLNDKTA
jgi:hypothetical protein